MLNKLKLKLNVLSAYQAKPEYTDFPKNQYWPELVHKGQVWRARMNDIVLKVRNTALILFIISLSADIAINTIGMHKITNWLSSVEATFVERWVLSPLASTKNIFKDEPVELMFTSRPVSSTDDISSATDVKVLTGFINKNIKSLNETNNLAYECDEEWNATQNWSYENRFDLPKCKIMENEIWIGSLVSDGPRSTDKKLMLGVFRKVDKTYQYYNVKLPANSLPTYVITGFNTVSAEMVSRSFSKAFPELVKKGDK